MQIRRARPEAKAYTLGDGLELALLNEQTEIKAGGSAIALSVIRK